MRALPFLLFALLLPAAPAGASEPMAQCRAAIAQAEREAAIPAGLLHAIGRVESGRRDPATGETGSWPWAINAEGQGRFLPDRAAAVAAVRELQSRGVRVVDVGCMQVNLHHHPRAFASLDEAFDPVANARYAARFLSELQAAAGGDWMVAAGRYHSHTPHLADAYRARVAAAWPAAREAAQRAAAAPALAARPVLAGAGGFGLSNGAERAQILPPPGQVAGLAAAPGRGLDAYRAAPVPIAGRGFAVAAGAPLRR